METKRPDLVNAVLPYGHVICSEKWRDSPLIQGLKDGDVRVLFEADLGVADLHLPGRSSVLYLSEAEVVGGGYRRRVVRYRNAGGGLQQLVLVQRGPLSLQDFPGLQRFVVLDLGLALLPVAGATEAAQLIAQIVHLDVRGTPLRRGGGGRRLLEPLVLGLVRRVPGVGGVRALALLQNFSVQQLSHASPAQLQPLVGAASAQQIHAFFHRSTRS